MVKVAGSKLRHLTGAVVSGVQDPRGIAMSISAGMSSIRSWRASADRRHSVACCDLDVISIRLSSPSESFLR
jgi:hypothetical protein